MKATKIIIQYKLEVANDNKLNQINKQILPQKVTMKFTRKKVTQYLPSMNKHNELSKVQNNKLEDEEKAKEIQKILDKKGHEKEQNEV